MSLQEPLEYTPQIALETAAQFSKVSRVIPEIEWPSFAPYVSAINALKRERNAII
ncbi:MAG: quinolinate synthase NadA, partial [Alphaproteobacteria bacterium]